jgi:type IV pilus assembly protein PilC
MAAFAYSAINAQGVESVGELQAPDLEAAREQLRQRGLLAQRLQAVQETGAAGASGIKKVKPKALQVFSRQFATLIAAGVSVVAALIILAEQTEDRNLAVVIDDVREKVEHGLLLSEAMALHPTVFDHLYVSMVEAGEAAGALDSVLDRVALQIEKQQKIRRRVKGAMIYPTIVLTLATVVMFGMMLFLVPMFVNIFKELGGQLPTLTRYTVGVSNSIRHWWFVMIPGLIATVIAFRRYKRTESGRRIWDAFVLRVPMRVGQTVLKVSMARFSRTLATLVASGVDIIKALEITAQTSGNAIVEEAVMEVKDRVQEGVPIAQPLLDSEIFPPMVSQMVKIGEETGELEQMLTKVADFYEDEVDSAIASLTSIIEPVMMIGVGCMVGVIVISMYLPMFKMLTLVK